MHNSNIISLQGINKCLKIPTTKMMTPFNIKERKYTQNLRMQKLIIYDNGVNSNKVDIDY